MNPLIIDNANNNPSTPVIVALDFPDAAQTLQFVAKLSPSLCRLKIGKELFTAEGAKLVEALIARGFDVFLDLKYHDIPNTVASACKVAADLGVWMLDVHASGGSKMIAAAREALAAYTRPPLLIAVTVLTSFNEGDLSELGIAGSIQDQVLRLATLAQHSGADGVVCSALEANMLRQACGEQFALVTPGIRLANHQANSDDQARITTPSDAMAAGSHYLVMGRPITRAADPIAVLTQIQNELAQHRQNAFSGGQNDTTPTNKEQA